MDLLQYYTEFITRDEALFRLRESALAGISRWKRGEPPRWMAETLDTELDILDQREDDLLQHFLILWDAAEYARVTDNLLGPGLGPLTECILAYGLGLTQVDPAVLPSFRTALRPAGPAPRPALEVGSDTIEELRDYLNHIYGSKWNGIELVDRPALARFQEILSGQEAHEVRILPGCDEESVWQAIRDIPYDDREVCHSLFHSGDAAVRFSREMLTGQVCARLLLLYQDTYFRIHTPEAYQKAWSHYPGGQVS